MASKAAAFKIAQSLCAEPACATSACAKLSLVFSTMSGVIVGAMLAQASSSARFSIFTVSGPYGATAQVSRLHSLPLRQPI